MRPKIYLPVLGVALGMVLWLLLGRNHPPPAPPPAPAPTPTNSAEASPQPSAEPMVMTPSPTLTVVLPPENTGVTANDLMSLAMNDDTESLETILAALASPDPEIRAAAREAAVQFGDASAAAKLREAASTASPAEKSALLEAADFLELPPLEIRARSGQPAASPPGP